MIRQHHPHLVPDFGALSMHNNGSRHDLPIGTTILALKTEDGVIIAGDRRAVEGFQVGERRIEKVLPVDDYSAIAIAGVAGPCIEMAKLFQIQTEYYEKIEGAPLTFEGKASFLSALVKSNLQAAMQGLIVMPIFAGYDTRQKEGRIFKYDITGGRYEETDFHAIGSGGKDARTTMKKLYKHAMDRESALKVIAEALWDAADEDIATGGPDFVRGIYPTIKAITSDGTASVPGSVVAGLYDHLLEQLRARSES
jgi:proteasome beta subunit